jgi:hypothetical protein
LRIAGLQVVDLIAWDNERMGMGKRSRRRGDYLVVLQRPPITAKTWTDHGIPSRWVEKVDRKIHPHIKPIGLIRRLIGTVTLPGDLVVDPAAGSFVLMHATHQLSRNFMGCDLAWTGSEPDHQFFFVRSIIASTGVTRIFHVQHLVRWWSQRWRRARRPDYPDAQSAS